MKKLGRKKTGWRVVEKISGKREWRKGWLQLIRIGGVDFVDVKVKGCAHIQRDGEGEWCWGALQSRWTLENERRMTKIEMLCCLCPYKDQLASAWPVYNTVMNWTTRLHYTVQFYNCYTIWTSETHYRHHYRHVSVEITATYYPNMYFRNGCLVDDVLMTDIIFKCILKYAMSGVSVNL